MSKKRFARIAGGAAKASAASASNNKSVGDLTDFRADPIGVASVVRQLAVVMSAIASARELTTNLNELRDVRNIIAEEGLSSGVSKLLTATGYASLVGEHMPAIENFSAVPLNADHRCVVPVLEALDASLAVEGEMSAKDATAVVDAMMEVIAKIAADIDYREDAVESAATAFKNTDISQAVFDELSGSSPDAEAVNEVMDVLVSAVGGMSTPVDFGDGTAEEVDAANSAVLAAVKEVGSVVGLQVSDDGDVEEGPVDEKFTSKTGTLTELGYNQSVLVALLGKAAALIDALENVRDEEDALREGFTKLLGAADEEDVAGAGDEEAPGEGEAAEEDDDGGDEDEDGLGDDDNVEPDADGETGEPDDTAEVAAHAAIVAAICNAAACVTATLSESYDVIVGLTEMAIQVNAAIDDGAGGNDDEEGAGKDAPDDDDVEGDEED